MKMTVPACILLSIYITVPCEFAFAGKLGDFEKSATREKSNSSTYYDNDHYDNDYHDGRGFFGFVFNVITDSIFGGRSSHSREVRSAQSEMAVNALLDTNAVPARMEVKSFDVAEFHEKKETGSPITPFFRADYSYSWAASDITADNYFVELGYRMFSVDFLQTHYCEKDPDDTLDLTRIYCQLRFVATEIVEFDIGLGGIVIDGEDSNSGGYYGLALRLYPDRKIGGELRLFGATVNEAEITDLDIGLFLGFDYFLLKTGYQLVSSGDDDIGGFYVGASVRL